MAAAARATTPAFSGQATGQAGGATSPAMLQLKPHLTHPPPPGRRGNCMTPATCGYEGETGRRRLTLHRYSDTWRAEKYWRNGETMMVPRGGGEWLRDACVAAWFPRNSQQHWRTHGARGTGTRTRDRREPRRLCLRRHVLARPRLWVLHAVP